jgi:hypothetical protein
LGDGVGQQQGVLDEHAAPAASQPNKDRLYGDQNNVKKQEELNLGWDAILAA